MNLINGNKLTAAARVADNPKTLNLNNIAMLWRRHCTDRQNHEIISELAIQLDRYLKEAYPSGLLQGMLTGMEAEVRSDTLQLLLNRYLSGRLQLSDSSSNGSSINTEIEIGVKAAWKIASLTTIRNLNKHSREVHLTEEGWNSIPDKIDIFPEIFWDLDLDQKLEITKLALEDAEKNQRISTVTAKVARAFFSAMGQINQTQLARELGVTPQAINQHLRKLRPHIRLFVETMGYRIQPC